MKKQVGGLVVDDQIIDDGTTCTFGTVLVGDWDSSHEALCGNIMIDGKWELVMRRSGDTVWKVPSPGKYDNLIRGQVVDMGMAYREFDIRPVTFNTGVEYGVVDQDIMNPYVEKPVNTSVWYRSKRVKAIYDMFYSSYLSYLNGWEQYNGYT